MTNIEFFYKGTGNRPFLFVKREHIIIDLLL